MATGERRDWEHPLIPNEFSVDSCRFLEGGVICKYLSQFAFVLVCL